MRTVTYWLFAAFLAVIIVLFVVFSFHSRSSTKGVAAAKTIPLIQTSNPETFSPSIPSLKNPEKPEESAGPSKLQDAQFTAFRESVMMFSQQTAKDLGLSTEDIHALQVAVWNARKRLNYEIAARAKIERVNSKETDISFHLDDSTIRAMQSAFYAEIQSALGNQKQLAIENSKLKDQIAFALDRWGEFATSYRVTQTNEKMGDDFRINVEVISDRNLQTAFQRSYSRTIFANLYGPVAVKSL